MKPKHGEHAKATQNFWQASNFLNKEWMNNICFESETVEDYNQSIMCSENVQALLPYCNRQKFAHDITLSLYSIQPLGSKVDSLRDCNTHSTRLLKGFLGS